MEMKKAKRFGVRRSNRGGVRRGGVRRGGAVLVEAAAATCFLLIPLLVGIIQFGLFYSATNALSQATRQGGRYAAVFGLPGKTDEVSVAGDESSDDYIKDRIIEVGQNGNIVIAREDITISPQRSGRTQYQPITVTVRYNLNLKSILLFKPGYATRTSVTMAE